MKNLLITVCIFSLIISCKTEKNDVQKAYFVEIAPENQTFVNIIDFNTSDKKNINGTLIILSDSINEKIVEIEKITIEDNYVDFDIPNLSISFKGKIIDEGFSLKGKFTLKDGSEQKLFAEKTHADAFYRFKSNYLNLE